MKCYLLSGLLFIFSLNAMENNNEKALFRRLSQQTIMTHINENKKGSMRYYANRGVSHANQPRNSLSQSDSIIHYNAITESAKQKKNLIAQAKKLIGKITKKI